jgi:hypothetical protein
MMIQYLRLYPQNPGAFSPGIMQSRKQFVRIADCQAIPKKSPPVIACFTGK